jgi:hypothetical protein
MPRTKASVEWWLCDDCRTWSDLTPSEHVCTRGATARQDSEVPPPTSQKKKRASKAKSAKTPKAKKASSPPPSKPAPKAKAPANKRGPRVLSSQEREVLSFVREYATDKVRQIGNSFLSRIIEVISAPSPDDDYDHDLAWEMAVIGQSDLDDEEALLEQELEEEALILLFADSDDEDWFDDEEIIPPPRTFTDRLREALQDYS